MADLYRKHKKGDWPDKGSVHSYIEVYEQLLAPYRDTAKNILEIGLMSGESLRMWSDYFTGTVYGMDCSITPVGGKADLTQAISEGYNIKIGDATNPECISEYFDGVKFDVIIEDANHDIHQQYEIYNRFRGYLKTGGIYIIEDVQSIENATTLADLTGGKIIDRRHLKNRYDDILIVVRK